MICFREQQHTNCIQTEQHASRFFLTFVHKSLLFLVLFSFFSSFFLFLIHKGPNCQCTETLCRCEASSVLNSVSFNRSSGGNDGRVAASASTTTSTARAGAGGQCRDGGGGPPQASGGGCCSNSSRTGSNDNANGIVGVRNKKDIGKTETTFPEAEKVVTTKVVDLGISGMTCSMCTSAVTNAVSQMDGVLSCNVSLALQEARIEYDPSVVTTITDLVDTIESIGYDVVSQNSSNNNNDTIDDDDGQQPLSSSSESEAVVVVVVDFTVTGMTCTMCSQGIERALKGTDGVIEANVSLSTNTAHVVYDSIKIPNIEAVREAIEDIGYDVVDTTVISTTTRRHNSDGGIGDDNDADGGNQQPVTEDRLERLLKQQQNEVDNRKRAFVWSFIGTLPILIITMVLSHFPSFAITQFLHRTVTIRLGHNNEYRVVIEAIVLWALCTPIQFGCGWPFYKSTYYGLKQGIMGMDVLVSVGTSASYGYALWAMFTPGSMEYHFFETSAGMSFVLRLGVELFDFYSGLTFHRTLTISFLCIIFYFISLDMLRAVG